MDIKQHRPLIPPPIQDLMTSKAGPDVIDNASLRTSCDHTTRLENLVLKLENGAHPRKTLEQHHKKRDVPITHRGIKRKVAEEEGFPWRRQGATAALRNPRFTAYRGMVIEPGFLIPRNTR